MRSTTASRSDLAAIIGPHPLIVPFVLCTDDESGPVCYYVRLLGIVMVIHERHSF